MTVLALNTAGNTTLDANGNGIVQLGPIVGQRWTVSVASVFIPNAVLIPTCAVYIGGAPIQANFIDGTYTGNFDSTDRTAGLPFTNGQSIWGVWSGGDVGAVATLSLIGTLETGYK